jgi:hypothetical protein
MCRVEVFDLETSTVKEARMMECKDHDMEGILTLPLEDQLLKLP